jgi:hypothetical protein
MNQNDQDIYLEPAMEINRESLDPFAASDSEAIQIVVCSSGC